MGLSGYWAWTMRPSSGAQNTKSWYEVVARKVEPEGL